MLYGPAASKQISDVIYMPFQMVGTVFTVPTPTICTRDWMVRSKRGTSHRIEWVFAGPGAFREGGTGVGFLSSFRE